MRLHHQLFESRWESRWEAKKDHSITSSDIFLILRVRAYETGEILTIEVTSVRSIFLKYSMFGLYSRRDDEEQFEQAEQFFDTDSLSPISVPLGKIIAAKAPLRSKTLVA